MRICGLIAVIIPEADKEPEEKAVTECRAFPDADEACVDEFAMFYERRLAPPVQWGYYGWSNNCGTFVAEVLNRCSRRSPGEQPRPLPSGGF